jgi:glycosyltransferase involved in cell wall biosynthesis
LLGESIHLSAQLPLCVEYLGWRSQKDTINILKQADVLYLPYWFKTEFDEECRNSFPSKLVTYFASGRPVMCHSPKYASPAKYIITNNAGYLCNSMSAEDIIDTLSSVESDKSMYEFYSKNGESCFKRDFTLGAMKASFQEFLGKI